MKSFKSIYYFEVFDYITAGKTVYILDKEYPQVYCANDLLVVKFTEIVNYHTLNKDRYYFWTVEEIEETTENIEN